MGPVTDPKHSDLLNDWNSVNAAFKKACEDGYRFRYLDDAQQALKFSLFCVSWSGFKTNPVQRDFGWHTIFDNYQNLLQTHFPQWKDELYWMYNHPPASGVGNEWGLDWLHNTHYLNILNRMIIDRNHFPNCVEIPTERNDSSHFLEQYIPFDFSNRNSAKNNLASINADGKTSGEVLGWQQSPTDWSHYHPHPDNYQLAGNMRRSIFRIVDIQSIVHCLEDSDIEAALTRAQSGQDTILCAYEHDFRDRYEVIMQRMIEPTFRLRKKFPEVNIFFETAASAARKVLGHLLEPAELNLQLHMQNDELRLSSQQPIFGQPYACQYKSDVDQYLHIPLVQIGKTAWQFPKLIDLKDGVIGVGINDQHGFSHVKRWKVDSKVSSLCSGIVE